MLGGLATAVPSQAAIALHCTTTGGAYRIEPWGDNSIRVRMGTDPTLDPKQPALLPLKPRETVHNSAGAECAVSSGNLDARLVSGKLVFTQVSSGATLLRELEHSVCAQCSSDRTGWMTFASSKDERIYGLGEHRTGRLDNHGISLDFMDAGVYDHHQGSDVSHRGPQTLAVTLRLWLH